MEYRNLESANDDSDIIDNILNKIYEKAFIRQKKLNSSERLFLGIVSVLAISSFIFAIFISNLFTWVISGGIFVYLSIMAFQPTFTVEDVMKSMASNEMVSDSDLQELSKTSDELKSELINLVNSDNFNFTYRELIILKSEINSWKRKQEFRDSLKIDKE
ncbi:hypothetical protein [Zophobihabitans entericus]|uniref:Uncharacterized protein n=1 Tax=Zophobihabitans entericus TaxID=1635327 RepID=A0A6G9IFD3_9GAMM|nr:hypothetical protein [Zophobihabitans entericus]QIQ22532.1 hypothetical protein IPMB12_12050 [Zophobihabitans entericus]